MNKISVSTFLGGAFGAFCAVISVPALFDAPLAGLLLLCNFLILCPPIRRWCFTKTKLSIPTALRVILVIIFTIAALRFLGSAQSEKDATREANRSPEEKAALALEYQAREREYQAKEEYRKLKNLDHKSQEILELLYIENVKDDAYFVKCKEAKFEYRMFYQCGVSYGNSDLAKKGLWEAAIGGNGKVILYAMNGNALRVLEKIGNSSEFSSGTSRPSVDIEKVNAEF